MTGNLAKQVSSTFGNKHLREGVVFLYRLNEHNRNPWKWHFFIRPGGGSTCFATGKVLQLRSLLSHSNMKEIQVGAEVSWIVVKFLRLTACRRCRVHNIFSSYFQATIGTQSRYLELTNPFSELLAARLLERGREQSFRRPQGPNKSK